MTLVRRLLWGLPVVGALAAGTMLLSQRGESAPDKAEGTVSKPADLKPAVSLPISQVILFNSGVGHFTRSGDIEGDARVDLTFPEQDINDLIKSMTLRDLSPNGRVAAVTYDSHDPIDRTLASFAINLNPPQLRATPDAGSCRTGRRHSVQHDQSARQPDRQDHRSRTAASAVEGQFLLCGRSQHVVRRRSACREDERDSAAPFR